MNKNRNKTIFYILLSVFVLEIIAGILFIIFIIKDKENTGALIEEVEQIKSENVFSMKQSLQIARPEISKMEGYFIDSQNIVGFINEVEKLAEGVGLDVEIQNVNVEDITRVKKKEVDGEIQSEKVRAGGQLLLTIQTRGSWSEVTNFLLVLEKIDKKINIETLRFSAFIDSETKQSTWNAIFNISVLTN